MAEPRPLIAVRDVAASTRWYLTLLDGHSNHGHRSYAQIWHDGHMVLQLHAWDDPGDRHEHLGRAGLPVGNGVLLWFRVEDYATALQRIGALGAEVLDELYNDNGQQRECWLKDPDGYVVVIAGPSEWERNHPPPGIP